MKTKQGTPEHTAKMRAIGQSHWTPEKRAEAKRRSKMAAELRRQL